jgi:hypothetical protein
MSAIYRRPSQKTAKVEQGSGPPGHSHHVWRIVVRAGLTTTLLAVAGGACGGGGPKLACPISVDQYCAAYAGCALTWADAHDPAPFCATNQILPSLEACGAYDRARQFFGDGSSTSYYDHASGALVAIVDFSANSGQTICEAGPAGGFAVPDCPPDGGTDSLVCDGGASEVVVR